MKNPDGNRVMKSALVCVLGAGAVLASAGVPLAAAPLSHVAEAAVNTNSGVAVKTIGARGDIPDITTRGDATPVPVKTIRAGGDIPIRSWCVADKIPWAAVLCLHGFGMSMNSYDQFGKQMAGLGVPTYAIDLRGFGCWQGADGYTELDFDNAVDDVHKALRALRKAHPNLPIVLIGESMGGAVALQAMASGEGLSDGLICSVPAEDRFGEKATNAKVALSMLKGKSHSVDMGKSIVRRITNDPVLRRQLYTAPRGRNDFSCRELMAFQKFMDQTTEQAKRIKDVPVLILQGGSDRLVKPGGTVEVYKQLSTRDKDLVLIGSSEHLILEEGQFDAHIIDVVTSWIYKSVLDKSPFEKLSALNKAGFIPPDVKKAGGHLRMAQGLLDLDDPQAARKHLDEAVALGRGTIVARVASQLLATLPGYQAQLNDSLSADARWVSHDEAMANDKPTIVFFGAHWIDSSHELAEVLSRGLKKYGNRVNFVRLDADAPKNQALVDAYGVTVVPTIMFLNPTNQVVSSALGTLTDQSLRLELPRIVTMQAQPPIAAPAPGELKSKPTVVVFGSNNTDSCRKVEESLQQVLAECKGGVDVVRINADKPENQALFEHYGRNRELPVVLFMNSSHDVIAYTTGAVGAGQLTDDVHKLLPVKKLPESDSIQ